MAAPKGNRYGAHDKPWTRALERHFAQNPDKLAKLAIVVADKALEGDLGCINHLADRLDGKPVQAVEMSGSVERKTAKEMTNDELARIASGSSEGTADTSEGDRTIN